MEQILDISLLRAQTNICVTFRTRMKLLFTSYDVMVSISEIKNQILGHRVINVYDVDNKTYLLKLASTKSDEKTILLLESGSRIHITDYDWPKNMMPSGFSMKLRKHIRNKKIVDVCQIGADRVVDIQIGYESSAYHLILELYDRGNMLLTDDTFTILHLLRPRTDKNQNIRFAAHEIYPIASCRQILKCFQDLSDQNSLTDIEDFLIPLFQSSKGPWKSNIQTCDKPYVNKTLSLELPYGNVVIEHCMRIAQKEVKQAKTINDFQLESSETYLMKLYVKHFAVALRDILLGPYSIDHQSSLKGYIFGKPHQSTEKGLQSYEEFHPFMFEQYREKPHLAFDSFNRAVDAFFSKIESQKTLGQISHNLHEDSVFKHKGERRIVVVNTPFSESSTCQVESSAFLNDEEHTEFPDAILQLDLAKDLPSHKDPDVVEIISENPSRKNKIKNKKVEKPKPNKKANNPPNLNKENIEKCEKLNKEPVPLSQQSLKRGQKSKLKKIKQKYKEQDEEERSLRMRILQGDDAKPSQYHQILERDHLLNQVKTSNSILDTQTVCDSDVIRNDQPDNNANLDIDDHFTESDDGSEESLRCSDVDNLKSKDNDDGDDDEDLSSESKDDLISLLNSLTGQPNDDDLLLYAIPVCAPYSVLLKFKFRVKLNPGNTKRGKASKMALFQFISDKSATNRERELIRAMKIEEVSRNFPGCVKITLPQIKSSLNK